MNVVLHIDGQAHTLENVSRKAQEVSFSLGDRIYQFRSQRLPDGSFVLEQQTGDGVWKRMRGSAWQAKHMRHVQLGGVEASIAERAVAGGGAGESELSPRAPMPGLIVSVLVTEGQQVKKGDPLVVMEAMKLQTTLSAGGDATVEKVLVAEGEKVTDGAELVHLVAIEEEC